MTNEEKAREIANNENLYGEPDLTTRIEECEIAAMEAMKWKDEQEKAFKTIHANLLSKFLSLFESYQNALKEIEELKMKTK